jgi:YbbR domain-containing protein
VPVSGPLEVLQSLTSVTTEPIDASGLRNDLTRTVRLRLPAGLQSTRDSASVRLKVAPAQGEMTLAVAPQISGVPEGLRASLQTASVSVRLKGELPALRALSPGAVRATVSANGLEEGVHILTPTISAPESAQVVSSDPAQVVVVLRK